MPAEEVKERAKELARRDAGEDSIEVLSTGVRVRLKSVSSMLIEDMRAAIKEPQVPTVWIEEKQRNEENPNDPKYLRALEMYAREMGGVTLDAVVLFGVELVDGLPEDDTWLKKLRYLEKRGRLDLSGYDLDDPFDREFLYKRCVAVGSADYDILRPLVSGIPAGEVRRARRSFLGDAERDTD